MRGTYNLSGSATRTLNFTTNGSLAINAAGSTSGTLISVPNLQIAGGVLTINVDTASPATTISSVIGGSGAGVTTSVGTGTLIPTGVSTYTGATSLNAGKVLLGSNGGLGATAVSVNAGSTLGTIQSASSTTNTIAGSLTMNAGSAFTMADSQTSTLNIAGAANLYGGTAGTAPNYTFDVGSASGVNDQLVIGGAATFGNAGATVTINPLSTLSLGNSYTLITGGSGSTLTTNGLTLSSTTVTIGATTYTLSLSASTANSVVVSVINIVTGRLYWKGSQDTVWNTNNSGNTNWTTDVGGTANSIHTPFDGQGTTDVFFAATGAAPAVTTLGFNTSIKSLNYLATAPAFTIDVGSALTINAGGIVGANGAGAQTINANVVLGASQTWLNNLGNPITVSGAISGANSLTLSGSGKTVFTNTGSSYSGGLTVASGVLTVDTLNNVSSNGELGNNTFVTLGGNSTTATLDYTGSTATPSSTMPFSLAGTGVFQVDSGTTNLSLTGVISGGAGLTKMGPGTLSLSAINTFTGNLTINAGTVVATTNSANINSGNLGNMTTANRTVTANAGATLSLIINDVFSNGANVVATLVANGGTITATRYNGIGSVTLNNGGTLTQNATDGTGTASYQGYQFTGGITADGTSATTISAGALGAGNHLGGNTNINVIGTTGALTISSRLINQSGNFANGNGAMTTSGAGTLILSGANIYLGGTTVSAGTLQLTGAGTLGDPTGALFVAAGQVDLGGTSQTVGALNGGGGTIFNSVSASTSTFTVGNNNTTGSYAGVLADNTGTGGSLALIKTGTGTETLAGSNTYSGGTTINTAGGKLAVISNTALGTGTVKLAGGTLQLVGLAGAIGIELGANSGGAGTPSAVTGTSNFGAYPIVGNDWNDFTGTNLGAQSGALKDNSGLATTAAVTSYNGTNTYNTGSSNALLNGYLDNTGGTDTVVLATIPYPNYNLYAYFGSDGAGRTGSINIGSTTYYYSTRGNVTDYVQTTDTTGATNPSANYAIFSGLTASGITINAIRGNNNSGLQGLEIVSTATNPPNLSNAVTVNSNSVIDVSGPPSGTISGLLTIGSNALSITGGGIGTNAAYGLSLGSTGGVVLTGNPTFSVSNNGAGLGTLTLGAMSDGGTLRTITIGNGISAGAVAAGSPATSLSANTAVNVVSGTLMLRAAGAFGATPLVTLSQAGTLNGNGQQLGGTVRGTGTITGALSFGSASVWPGAAINTATYLTTANETLNVGAGSTIDLTNSGKLKIILTTNGTTVTNQTLNFGAGALLAVDSTSILSLATTPGGQYGTTPIPIVTGVLGSATITTAFNPSNVLSLPAGWAVKYTFNGSAPFATFGGGNPTAADTVVLVPTNAAVTPVTLESFSATREGFGTLLAWRTISEYQNAGFNVYRRTQESGDGSQESGWTRVNPALIAGRITNPDAKGYALYDWAPEGRFEYRLESVSVLGVHEDCPWLSAAVTIDFDTAPAVMAANGLDAIAGSFQSESSHRDALAASAAFARIANQTAPANNATANVSNSITLARDEQGALVMPATARDLALNEAASRSAAIDAAVASAWNTLPSQVLPAASARWFSSGVNNIASSFTGAKVLYNTPGVMLIPQSMLPDGFDAGHVSIQREGRALTALARTSAGLIMYGQGYQDDYTDKDAMFLRHSTSATSVGSVAQASGLFAGGQSAGTDTPSSVTVSYHDVYFDYNTAYRPYIYAPWFSSQYLTDGSDQQFALSTPFAGTGPAALTVTLWSLTSAGSISPDHALQVVINGQPVGQAQWSGGQKMMQLTFQVPAGVLNAGANQIDLVTPELGGVSSQICFLYSLAVGFSRVLDGSQPVTVTNAGAATQLFELNHVPSASAWVVDTRFPDRAALVPYEAQVQADGTYNLRFNAASGGTGQFLVVPFGQENLPISVTKCAVKPAKNFAYMAVGPVTFSAGVQPLLALHNKEGIRGSFVDQEQLFDYYNYGRYGPAGIQNAVQALRPQFLLLLGRTTYDYRNYSGLNVDPMCPTFLVPTSFWAQATSDSMFGDLGRGYPEVAVGRLPANNTSELNGMVQRILNYGGAPVSGIRVQAVADEADPTVADFPAQTAAMGQALPELAWQPNYLGVTYQTSPEVTAAMTAAANGGADWVVYVGHGNASRLGKNAPRILDTDLISAWTGNVVLLQSTCTANWAAADQANLNTIAIQGLTQPQGGISASIASSTYMNSDSATAFMTQLMMNANSSGARWGTALMKAQQWAASKNASGSVAAFYGDLNKTEQIFGDPAMPVFMKNAPAGTKPNGGNDWQRQLGQCSNFRNILNPI